MNPQPNLFSVVEGIPADIASQQAETAARASWTAYRTKAEPLGLDFGEKMYTLRGVISAQGKDGEGLCAWLHKEGIPRRTAYYWINSYEVSIGVREPEAPKPEATEKKLVILDAIAAPKPEALEPSATPATVSVMPSLDDPKYRYPATVVHVKEPVVNPTKKKPVQSVELPSPGPIEPVCAFDPLISALYCLTNNGNDGVEHKFITMMEEALARCESNSVSGDGRETVIYLLDRVSKEFAIYAQRFKGLKNAGFVQAGLSVTNRGMAYQTDHSAPKFEVANAS